MTVEKGYSHLDKNMRKEKGATWYAEFKHLSSLRWEILCVELFSWWIAYLFVALLGVFHLQR